VEVGVVLRSVEGGGVMKQNHKVVVAGVVLRSAVDGGIMKQNHKVVEVGVVLRSVEDGGIMKQNHGGGRGMKHYPLYPPHGSH